MARSTNTDKPKKERWYKQFWQVFVMTKQQDHLIVLWLALAFFGVIGLASGIGALIGNVLYLFILGVPAGLLAAMVVLSTRAQWAAYKSIEGREGATYAALSQIRRGWSFDEEPVAVDARTHDMVFRGFGRPGVVLVGEGERSRLPKLFDQEKKKIARVAPDVPIVVLECGNSAGQVPLRKIARKVKNQKSKLTKNEVDVVMKRVQSMGGLKMPIPKGVDPTKVRPNRKALRG